MAKEQEQLITKKPIKFNSSIIGLLPNSITLTQERQYKNLSMISIKPTASTSSKRATRSLLTPKD